MENRLTDTEPQTTVSFGNPGGDRLAFGWRTVGVLTGGLGVLAGLFLMGQRNYLLFHTVVEIGAVAVAWSVFLLIWSARSLYPPPGFVMLGVGYLFVGALDMLHALAFEGMGVFTPSDTNLATQLWIAARYTEAFTLLLFPFSLACIAVAKVGKALLALVAGLFVGAIFWWPVFPVCFNWDTGLTPFKILSEYLLMGLFAIAAGLTWRRRSLVGKRVAPLLVGAMLVTMVSEFTFTLYASPFGMASMAGHLLKVVSFALLYRALVAEGIERPLETLGYNLQAQVQRFESLIATTTDGFWIVGLDGRILDANAPVLRMLGYSRETMLSMMVHEVDTQENPEDTARHIQKILRHGSEVFETQHRRRDGSIIDVVVSCSYLSGPDPTIVAFVRDNTDRKRAESQLQYQAAITAQVSDAVIATDLDLRITSWNPAAERIYGWTAAEALGRHVDELLKTQWLEVSHEQAQATFAAAGAWKGEILQTGKTGRQRIIEASVSGVFDALGHRIGFVTANRDMTDRRKAEELLASSEQRYRHIVETAQEGIWMLDGQGMTTYVNEKMAEMLGTTVQAMRGHSFLDYMAPKDIALAETYFQRRRDGIREQHDFRFVRSDGSPLWALVSTNPTVDGEGNLKSVLGMLVDISERKKAENALRISEQRYRSIVSALPDLLFCIDSDLRFTDVQTPMSGMLLAPIEEIIGRTAEELLPNDIAELTRQKVLAALETRQIQIYHYALDMGGAIRECETRMVSCGDEQVLAIVRDITEARQAQQRLEESEARYHSIVDDQSELVCRFDTNGRLTFVNHAYCRYFDKAPEHLLGHRFSPMIPDSEREYVEDQFSALSQDHPLVTYEHRVMRADGQVCWMEWSDRALYDTAGCFIEYQAVGRDISDRKRLQYRLMEASEREQRRLAQELHDGLCQDLKSLEIEAALLEDAVGEQQGDAEERAAQLGRRINETVRAAYATVRGMLPAGLDAKGFPAALASLVDQMAGPSTAQITTDIQGNLMPDSALHAYHLYRITQEALGNAIHHAQASAITVQWSSVGQAMVLTVQDNGKGIITPESARPDGGMGLLVMRSRAHAIGANIQWHGGPGQGTRVHCVLQKGRADAPRIEQTEYHV